MYQYLTDSIYNGIRMLVWTVAVIALLFGFGLGLIVSAFLFK
jgi:hypothetical protein